ncbi:MAG: T9SS type A sorting domain-containing protein [Calditrichaeota bacterium]|nr:T9SS type A sorting domain-containing protein [Calditrichota bacterium]
MTLDASNLASGMYLYRLKVGEYTETKKMMLMR